MTLFHFIRYVLDITPIALFDIEGNLIKKWNSTMEIERQLGIKHTHISACCLNKKYYKTAGGYVWKYDEVVDSDN